MKFLNCLLNTCPNLNTRVYLQHELETAGLDVNLMEEVRVLISTDKLKKKWFCYKTLCCKSFVETIKGKENKL